MPTLTLHHGESRASFEQHPIEVARKALLAAAAIERDGLAQHLRRIAEALPNRAPEKGGE